MITLVRVLIILGLCLDVFTIWFVITKYRFLENLLLLHWSKMAAAIFLAMLGFSVGFVSECLELCLPSVYEGFLEQALNSLELALITGGMTIWVYMWWRVWKS